MNADTRLWTSRQIRHIKFPENGKSVLRGSLTTGLRKADEKQQKNDGRTETVLDGTIDKTADLICETWSRLL